MTSACMKRLVPFMMLLSAFLLSNSAAAQHRFTLEQCIEYALEHNLQILDAQNQEESSGIEVRAAKTSLYPNMSVGAEQNWGFGQSQNLTSGVYSSGNTRNTFFNASSSVTLFSGFQKINTIAQTKAQLMASENNLDNVKNEVLLNVATTFLQILYAQERVEASTEQVQVSQEQVENAEKRVKAGAIPEGEMLQLRAQRAADQVTLTEVQNEEEISIINLKQLLNISPDQTLEIEPPSDAALSNIETGYEFQDVYQEALQIHPSIKLAENNTHAAELGVKVAKGGYYPTLSFGAGMRSSYTYSEQIFDGVPVPVESFSDQMRDNFGQSLGFSLNIPIFNNLQVRNDVSRAQVQLKSSQNAEMQARNQLSQTIAQAVTDLKAAERRYQSAREAFESASLAYDYAQKRFDVGMTNTVELNVQKNNLSNAQADMIQAKYDLIFKSKVIDYYLGRRITFY